MFRHIEGYLGIIEAYGAIIKKIRNFMQPLHIQPCHIQNPGFLEPEASSKSCQTCKMIMHI